MQATPGPHRMDVEQQIRHRFEGFVDRLRDNVERQLHSEADELAVLVESERAAAAAEATRTTRETIEREATERIAQAVAAIEAKHARVDTAELPARERLAEAFRAIDRALSLSE